MSHGRSGAPPDLLRVFLNARSGWGAHHGPLSPVLVDKTQAFVLQSETTASGSPKARAVHDTRLGSDTDWYSATI